ncbi:hypothetical protein [Xenorhabdus entomophaga]|uniref:hypothetical protein n=1 Tax=Xenorhabdus entomophaga TaxID=3136257 RepID=UPI0030F3F2B2
MKILLLCFLSDVPYICAATVMLYGGSNLASAADLRSGEIRVMVFLCQDYCYPINHTDREGLSAG